MVDGSLMALGRDAGRFCDVCILHADDEGLRRIPVKPRQFFLQRETQESDGDFIPARIRILFRFHKIKMLTAGALFHEPESRLCSAQRRRSCITSLQV